MREHGQGKDKLAPADERQAEEGGAAHGTFWIIKEPNKASENAEKQPELYVLTGKYRCIRESQGSPQ